MATGDPVINLSVSSTGKDFEEMPTGSHRDSREGKGRYDLISPLATRRLAIRLEAGAVKYGDRNWEKGQTLGRYFDSAKRHLDAYQEGKRDEDHLGAAYWNIHCMLHTEEMVLRGLLPQELYDMPNFSNPKEPGDGDNRHL